MIQDFSNRVRDLAQVLSGRRHVDVGDSLNLVVVHFRRRLNKPNLTTLPNTVMGLAEWDSRCG